jgi:diaminobutyrate-2-oxoglutarate transaminase
VRVLSKALGGSLPLAAVVYGAAFDRSAPGAHAGAFRGDHMVMAAGTVTLCYIQYHYHRLDEYARWRSERVQTAAIFREAVKAAEGGP